MSIEDRSEQFTAQDERESEIASNYESQIEALETQIDDLNETMAELDESLQAANKRTDEYRDLLRKANAREDEWIQDYAMMRIMWDDLDKCLSEFVRNSQAVALAQAERIRELEAAIKRRKEKMN